PACARTGASTLSLPDASSDLAARAWAAKAEGRSEAALALMREAAAKDDASEKHVAMENRLVPMRELLAEMLLEAGQPAIALQELDRKSTRLNSSHQIISYAVF